ncbi:MAG: DUF4012 domain-containing protein, partial [Candidatus Wolfebacteria bacterium]|nr:DUF4012 domain-containing protein [Candidatus Wolfebacteria bacterium]
MKEVPKKNTEPILVDVKTPNFNYERLGRIETVHLKIQNGKAEARVPKALVLVLSVILIAGIAGAGTFLVGLKSLKATAKEKGERIALNFMASAKSLKELEPEKAKEALEKNKLELEEITKFTEGGKKEVLLGGLGELFPKIGSGIRLIKKVSEFNLNLLGLTENVTELKENGFTYFKESGGALVALLRDTEDKIKNLVIQAAEIKNKTGELADFSSAFEKLNANLSDSYIKQMSGIDEWNGALEDIIALLDSKVDRNILLIFHNPSEIRPAGGFIGSYGVLTVQGGQMRNLEVGDIYWPDHPMNFERKIIPPLPLQGMTKDWGARDGNWFFDFPTSAKIVKNFLESSKVYAEKKIQFDGVIAINTNVLETLLKLVGPIPVPEYELVINENNFLAELQREVETGKDKQKKENPKKILSVVAPTIMERLGMLPNELKQMLIENIDTHIKEKDIMFVFENGRLASFLKTKGVDGSVYELPAGFWGNYLAVVNANVAGGKSDAFMDEMVRGRIDVSNDGSSFVNLTVARTHNGKNEKDPWYTADNKDFIQIYVNPNSSLIDIQGGAKK